MHAPRPKGEGDRLRALKRYAILDSTPEPSLDRATRLAATTLNAPIALVSLVDKGRLRFVSRHGLDIEEMPRDGGFCAHAILGTEVLVVGDAARDPRFAESPLVSGDDGVRFYAGAPLGTPDGHTLGTLCVMGRAPRAITDGEATSLRDLAAVVVDALELRRAANEARKESRIRQRLEKEVRRLANTDPLTGAYTRRHLIERGRHEAERAQRYRRPLSLVVLTVDRFRSMNEAHGLGAGEAALKRLATLCRDLLRRQDIMGRVGVEHIVLLLPETGEGAAVAVAERLRRKAADLRISTEEPPFAFTVSAGVTSFVAARDTFDAALARADRALGQARRDGRNRVALISAAATSHEGMYAELAIALSECEQRRLYGAS